MKDDDMLIGMPVVNPIEMHTWLDVYDWSIRKLKSAPPQERNDLIRSLGQVSPGKIAKTLKKGLSHLLDEYYNETLKEVNWNHNGNADIKSFVEKLRTDFAHRIATLQVKGGGGPRKKKIFLKKRILQETGDLPDLVAGSNRS